MDGLYPIAEKKAVMLMEREDFLKIKKMEVDTVTLEFNDEIATVDKWGKVLWADK